MKKQLLTCASLLMLTVSSIGAGQNQKSMQSPANGIDPICIVTGTPSSS